MPDLLHELFDPRVPPYHLSVDRVQTLNAAKARAAALERLRTRPILPDRVPLMVTLLEHLGVARTAASLREICTDEAVPAPNRAAPAYLLLMANLDPGATPAQLPALLEALLVGCAAMGDIEEFQPVLEAICSSGVVDLDALVSRLERWRPELAAPPVAVYQAALSSKRCAAAHRPILAALERDPELDALVQSAAMSGALAAEVAHTYQSRQPPELVEASGRAWSAGVCDGCRGMRISGLITLGESTLRFYTHLSSDLARDSIVTPSVGAAEIERFTDALGGEPAFVEVPLERLVATARTARPDALEDHRLLWLLRRFRAGSEGLEFPVRFRGLEPELPDEPEDLDLLELAWRLAEDHAPQDLFDAMEEIVAAARWGDLRPATGRAGWSTLFDVTLRVLEEIPLRWGEEVDPDLPDAWSSMRAELEAADAREGLHPTIRTLLTDPRADRLAWRELLMFVNAEHGSGSLSDLGAMVQRHEQALARLGFTAADISRALGAPEGVAGEIAGILGIEVDAPLATSRQPVGATTP